MTNSKIITKPFNHGDEVGKSRNITGINKWARSSRSIGVIMLILGWFTIPFEVVFRRDFGQRWFTATSFFTGLFLIFLFAVLQDVYDRLSTKLYEFFSWLGPLNPVQENTDSISYTTDWYHNNTWYITLLSFLYFYMGLYHLFKIKWRNQANIPLHSFDDGTSRLGGFARIYVWLLNIVAMPFLGVYWLLIPRSQRRGKPFPKLITDQHAFTNVVFEPFVVFCLAANLTSITSFWFFLSGFAMAVHGHWREMARKAKMLDFQDSRIEAGIMREMRHAKEMDKTAKEKKKAAEAKKPVPHVAAYYPKLSTIIEEMNQDRRHLAK